MIKDLFRLQTKAVYNHLLSAKEKPHSQLVQSYSEVGGISEVDFIVTRCKEMALRIHFYVKVLLPKIRVEYDAIKS